MKRILLLIALLICAGCQGKGANLSFADLHNHPPGTLRVLTYNINWGHDDDFHSDPVKTINAIKKLKADILVLQEITPEWEKTFRKELGHTYPYQDYQQTGNGGGKAVLSKFPIVRELRIHSPFGWYPTQADLIRTNFGLVQLINVHLTPSYLPHAINGIKKVTSFEAPNRRLQEIAHFFQHTQAHLPTIIAGDFNESDKGFAVAYLHKVGFKDAMGQNRDFHTWYRNFGPIAIKRRIDHVFYNKNLRAFRVQVFYEGGSDHYPLVVDFDRLSAAASG